LNLAQKLIALAGDTKTWFGNVVMAKPQDVDTFWLPCDCNTLDHLIEVSMFPSKEQHEATVFIHVQLSNSGNILRRTIRALKYIAGIKSRYGHWDETQLCLDKAKLLRDKLTKFIDNSE